MRLSVIYCFDHCYISCFIIICCVPHFYLPAPILIVLGDVHFGIVRLQHATSMRWHRMRSTVPRWWDMGDNHTQTRSTSPNIDSVGGDCVVHLYAQIAFAVCIRRWITDVLFVPSIVQRQSQRASASNQRNRNKFIFYFFNLYLSRRSNDDLGKQNHFQVNILLFIFSRARTQAPFDRTESIIEKLMRQNLWQFIDFILLAMHGARHFRLFSCLHRITTAWACFFQLFIEFVCERREQRPFSCNTIDFKCLFRMPSTHWGPNAALWFPNDSFRL